jgi:aminoglycoside 3-N-acetyltransferase
LSQERNWRAQPEVTRAGLAADLRRLGLRPGDVVLVHSSLSRLGNVQGGADAAIDALLDAVSPSGTVLFPVLTGSEHDGPDCPPTVEVRETPCWTGRIPETARRRGEAVRSLHPTHSIAAIGQAASRFAAGHEDTETPCDERSPYYRLIREGGSILLLGADHESDTSLHCLEELAGVPYHLQDGWTDGVMIDPAGRRVTVRNRLHLWRWHREFARVDAPLEAGGAQVRGTVGLAEARLVRADGFAETLLPILRADPLYLLRPDARQEYLAEMSSGRK